MKKKNLGGWVSILAILFVSLMPIISQAFEKNQPNDYQLICSSNGHKLILINDNNEANDSPNINISHCNYCSFSIDDEVIFNKSNKNKNPLLLTDIELINVSSSTKDYFFLLGNPPQAPPSI
tara:strand:- start:2020 stop:2385 length:366 start_codon:yes stop_codon:yes gene_type:complete